MYVLPPIKQIIQNNWKILEASCHTEALANKDTIIGFKRATNLQDLLVHSRIRYNPATDHNPAITGAKHKNTCDRQNCKYCTRMNCTGNAKSTQTGRTYGVPKGGCCESSNLVYLLTCTTCQKQYVGQTKRPLRDRLREHFRYISNKITTQPWGRHCAQTDHSGLNIEVQILEYIRTPPNLERSRLLRLEREKHWMHQFRSIEPFGLNIMGRWAHSPRLMLKFFITVAQLPMLYCTDIKTFVLILERPSNFHPETIISHFYRPHTGYPGENHSPEYTSPT